MFNYIRMIFISYFNFVLVMAETNLVVGEEKVFEYLMQQRAHFYPNAKDVKEWKSSRERKEG